MRAREPQETVAAEAVGGGALVLGERRAGRRRRARGRAPGGSAGSRGRRRRARAAGRAARSGRGERARSRPARATEHGHLDERLTCRREHARELARGTRRRPRRRAGAGARGSRRRRPRLLSSTPSSRSPGTARNVTFGAVTCARACSSIAGETSSASTRSNRSASAPVIRPGPAADLDAGPPARIGAEPPEEPRQLGCPGRRVADVDGGVAARERVPRSAHLQARQRVSAYPVYARGMVAAEVRPAARTRSRSRARRAGDATRTFRDGDPRRRAAGRARGRLAAPGRRRLHLRATSEGAFEEMRFCLGDRRRPHAVRAPLPARPVASARAVRLLRGLRPVRTRDRRPGAPARALRPADPRQRGARDGAADHPRAAPSPAPAGGTRRRPLRISPASRPPSLRAARPARAPRRDARPPLRLGARAPEGAADRGGRRPPRARARPRPVVGRGRLPRGARPFRARPRGRPRARQAARPRCAAGGSRAGRPPSCSSRTASGPAWRASTCSPAGRTEPVPVARARRP